MSNLSHGHARKGAITGTYRSWQLMHRRCAGYTEIHKEKYLDRGIAVCARWDDFDLFLQDMGERPEGKTLDRIDVDKGYSPENCRWATKTEQMQNRTNNVNLTLNGVTKCVAEWSRLLGLHVVTIHRRLKRGLPAEMALGYGRQQLKGK